MKKDYGPTIVRAVLGLMFILPGLMKLMSLISTGTHPVVGMLWGSTGLAWLLALVEVIFGTAVLIGWKVKYTVWPLIIVLIGAIFTAVIPSRATNPFWTINLMFHMLGVASMIDLSMNGPGAVAVDDK